MTTAYDLRCRECGKSYGIQPLSIRDECFSPLEVVFDLEYARTRFTRDAISNGPWEMASRVKRVRARSRSNVTSRGEKQSSQMESG